jgi:hypothetical protein
MFVRHYKLKLQQTFPSCVEVGEYGEESIVVKVKKIRFVLVSAAVVGAAVGDVVKNPSFVHRVGAQLVLEKDAHAG